MNISTGKAFHKASDVRNRGELRFFMVGSRMEVF